MWLVGDQPEVLEPFAELLSMLEEHVPDGLQGDGLLELLADAVGDLGIAQLVNPASLEDEPEGRRLGVEIVEEAAHDVSIAVRGGGEVIGGASSRGSEGRSFWPRTRSITL